MPVGRPLRNRRARSPGRTQNVRGHEAPIAVGAEAQEFRLTHRVPNQPVRE